MINKPRNHKDVVIKLKMGDELICRVNKEILPTNDLFRTTEDVIIYEPMKATVEMYYERTDDKVGVFERTMMTPWIRFASAKEIQLPSDMILGMFDANPEIVKRYEDLLLKYHTYDTNPELAEQLYGGEIDPDNFFADPDEDYDEEDGYDDEEDDEDYS